MSDNWIVANLENAFSTWNDKMAEIWQLLTTSPQNFKGGAIWNVISGINGGLQAIGLGLLVLFFAMSIFKSTASFCDFQRPEYALKHFIRFCAAKVAITYAMDLMTAIYTICGGIVEQIAGSLGGIGGASVTLPAAIEQAVEDTGFWASIPLWLVTILGSLFITVLSFIMIMTVYGRFFKLYIYTAIAPVPLSSFAGETTSFMGKSFLKSYVGVCMEGAVTVIVVDVNGLKEINDSYGHFCGDDAIKTVAKALRDTIGLKADIYRIGGDEFVCISESNVLPYISQFKDTIYFINNEKLYNLSVSIGYSKYHEKYTKSIDDIICRADKKMYMAKKDKK